MRQIKNLLTTMLILALLVPSFSFAVGEGNIDGGGGGMGTGSSGNSWSGGNDGVRITIVRSSNHSMVTAPIDLTNIKPPANIYHFNKTCKLQYSAGTGLNYVQGGYKCTNPSQKLPRIINTSGGSNIAAIKSYFTDEQVIRSIAALTGMNFETLINGEYKLLLEPIAYYLYSGNMIATTATEAALYDEIVKGDLRKKMTTLTHKNMPLAMFLETEDLGYPAWKGSRNALVSNGDIKAMLGLGAVRFNGAPPKPPEVTAYDYEYRVDTDVITAITVHGGESNPDKPVTATFYVGGNSYTASNIYYPSGDSQLAWIRWHTPSTPQKMNISVTVNGGGSVGKANLTVNVVDFKENTPPNPVADDRHDAFRPSAMPINPEKTRAAWTVWRPWWQEYWVWISNWCWVSTGEDDGYWEDNGWWEDHGWWEFSLDRYQATLTGNMAVTPDEKSPTATANRMKSGYGINERVTGSVWTNQSHSVTGVQNAITFFPEFGYQTYWRIPEQLGSRYDPRFEFKKNEFSTYNRRTHFTPIWFPDGRYEPYTWLLDCWTPDGMLSVNLSDYITIEGNLWQDWHIAPQKPN